MAWATRLAEWLFEHGIGETRAALVKDGHIAEAAIELPGGLRGGTILSARLTEIIAPGRVGLVAFEGGEALVQPLPREVTQGSAITVEITREAIGHKRAVARAADGRELRQGPNLHARIAATGLHVRRLGSHEPDALEDADWSELVDAATTGITPFSGGALLMSLTPAMTLFDIDGTLAPEALAVAGAAAAGRAIRAFDIGGSIGIDLPTSSDRAVRLAAATALDAVLPKPFERTAVNGFGFLQVVRPQQRASLPQLLATDRIGAAVRALLRRAERTTGAGTRTLRAHPDVIARAEGEPAWLAELARRTGVPIVLRAVPGLAISSGHVDAEHP